MAPIRGTYFPTPSVELVRKKARPEIKTIAKDSIANLGLCPKKLLFPRAYLKG